MPEALRALLMLKPFSLFLLVALEEGFGSCRSDPGAASTTTNRKLKVYGAAELQHQKHELVKRSTTKKHSAPHDEYCGVGDVESYL